MTKEEQREYSKEVYYWRKAHKICVYCGHEKAEPGRITCPKCKKKRKQHATKYYNAELSKARYKERKEKRLCVICGKPCMKGKIGESPSLKKKCIYCKEHYDKLQASYQEKKKKRIKEQEVKND